MSSPFDRPTNPRRRAPMCEKARRPRRGRRADRTTGGGSPRACPWGTHPRDKPGSAQESSEAAQIEELLEALRLARVVALAFIRLVIATVRHRDRDARRRA